MICFSWWKIGVCMVLKWWNTRQNLLKNNQCGYGVLFRSLFVEYDKLFSPVWISWLSYLSVCVFELSSYLHFVQILVKKMLAIRYWSLKMWSTFKMDVFCSLLPVLLVNLFYNIVWLAWWLIESIQCLFVILSVKNATLVWVT